MIDGTPLLRLYAGRRRARLARQDAVAEQRRQLQALLSRAADTAFGRRHDFARLRSPEEFRRAVPLRTYDEIWREWLQPAYPVVENVLWPGRVPYFALSSGTSSGRTKYIPVSHEMVASNRRAALDVLCWHLQAHPASRPFRAATLLLGGSTELLQVAPGVQAGDLSAIAAINVPWYAQRYSFPPNDIALMADWDAKLERLAQAALGRDFAMLTGTPSWVLILLDRIAELVRARGGGGYGPLDQVELYVHGGVSWGLYQDRFRPFLQRSGAATREVYPASEGFVAVADRGEGEGLRLLADTGIFYEFVPVEELGRPDPARHWLAEVEEGVNYAIVLTTCAGLFSYVLGDTVRFVSRDPPRVLITGRTAAMMSAFGEHLILEEIEGAVGAAADACGLRVREFTMGAVLPDGHGSVGHHLLFVECEGDGGDARSFAGAVDRALADRNDDYRAHRDGAGMGPPEVRLLPPGALEAWLRAQGRVGGQVKMPRVLTDAGRFADLRRTLGG